MLNSEGFKEKIQEILDHYELSASSFAEKIDVGRSSISHIISGRNKPSLEFIMKINEAFPEIDLYWLMGISNTDKHITPLRPSSKTLPASSSQPEGRKIALKEKEMGVAPVADKENSIERIIVLYKDGHFKTYESF